MVPGPDAVRKVLRRIVQHPAFANAERMRRFLEYTVESTLRGRADQLKEYVIGIEVFDRPANYDPRVDPVVRNEARRLRNKLQDYYQSPTADRSVIIEIPKGSYVPVFGSSAGRQGSIAVLPFVNLTSDSENEFFSDGLTEEVINALAQLRSLRVAARTSCFQFKNRLVDIREAGALLGVEQILEGSVRRAGDRYRIAAQLIDVVDGFHRWSRVFDIQMQDVFELQERIAREITGVLAAPAEAPLKRHTANPLAYELYWRGRYHWSNRTPGWFDRCTAYFRQAIQADPGYALAYSSLSDTFGIAGFYGFIPGTVVAEQGKATLDRALELDPMLPEAHCTKGAWLATCTRDFNGAGRAFQDALAIDPENSLAHAWWALISLAPSGEFGAAAERVEIARQLDPLSLVIHSYAGWIEYFAGRHESALRRLDHALELQSGALLPLTIRGMALEGACRYKEALDVLCGARRIAPDVPFVIAALAHCHAAAGNRSVTEELLSEMQVLSASRYVSPYDLAVIAAGLGQRERAGQELERARAEIAPWLMWRDVDPRLRDLRH